MAEYAVGQFGFQTLQEVRGKMGELWQNDTWNKRYQRPDGFVFNKLATKQAIRLTEQKTMTLADNTRCQVVSLSYMQNCDKKAYACDDADADTMTGADACNFDAPQTGIKCENYATVCIGYTKFAVKHTECRADYTYEEIFAEEMMASKYVLDEQTNKANIAFLIANRSTLDPSALQGVGGLNADGDVWEVDITDIKPEFIACLKLYARKCKMLMPCIVSGELWEKQIMLAQAQAGGGCCNHNSLLFDSFFDMGNDIYDLDNMAGTKSFFLVDMASIAYVNSKLFANSTPMSATADRWTWYTNSMNLNWSANNSNNSVLYDVEMVRECCGKGEYLDKFRLTHHGGFMLAPRSCPRTDCGPIVQISVKCDNC